VHDKFGHERGVMIHIFSISDSTWKMQNTSNHARYEFLTTVTPNQCGFYISTIFSIISLIM
jgi:hypothetical protein